MTIFDISGDDIALLDDSQLRILVGRLCEAELLKRGQSTTYVRYGGDQNAADGGIDVRVELPTGTLTEGFIPRAATGFQVKKQAMPPAAIRNEMCPNGVLRPSIRHLADREGAYIIVSSEESTSDSALQKRCKAMAEAIHGCTNAEALALEFYDRSLIANWVRTHEPLVLWVREKIGRPIPGWQPYGPWASPVGEAFIIDRAVRMHSVSMTSERDFEVSDGIQALRRQLRDPRQVVRLVGLSGVGKTRLVQALFDDRVGENRLDPGLAIYTNTADQPDPPPVILARQLVASDVRAILVVDNCPPDLHQRLAEVCGGQTSLLSLLTVEYDIREDLPEGTDVFKLEPASSDLIEILVGQRHPNVSAIDLSTIARFSGGNARVALALAETVGRQGSLAGLKDEQVFQRLFVQRHSQGEGLYLSAQACSLVYSFHGEDLKADGELDRLSRTVGRSPQELFRAVAELQRRELVQRRGVWRAVLPQAIANRIAVLALQNIPYQTIAAELVHDREDRLLKSFARRLGYLHASGEAVEVVRGWVGPGGFLSEVASLNEFKQDLLKRIAPAAPEEVLKALERALTTENPEVRRRGMPYLDLLRSLAYDSSLFERSTSLMTSILSTCELGDEPHEAGTFTSLFQLHLSGTHATIEQRIGVIKRLLGSGDARQRALGVRALGTVLQAGRFTSWSSFEFGAHSRDFGYLPRTREQFREWFNAVLDLVQVEASSNHSMAPSARTALAKEFRGLWSLDCVTDKLCQTCHAIADARFWPEGWLEVRRTLDFDGEGMSTELRERLVALEHFLRPANLEEKVRSIVFSRHFGADLDDYDEKQDSSTSDRLRRADAIARELGREVAADDSLLTRLLPEIVSSDGLLGPFGMGLAETSEPRLLWLRLTDAIAKLDARVRNPLVLRGFLCALHDSDPDLMAQLLDDAVYHETHSQYYPYLQVAVPIGERDIERLKRSLALRKTPAERYMNLAAGMVTAPIPPEDFRAIVLAIGELPGGYNVAIKVLHMHLEATAEQGMDAILSLTGQNLLRHHTFTNTHHEVDYSAGEIARRCLSGEQGRILAQELCGKLKNAVARHETFASSHVELLKGIFSSQPYVALNAMCSGNEGDLETGIAILTDARTLRDLMALVPEVDLLEWCEEQPDLRFPAIARVLPLSSRTVDGGPLRWTSVALRLLQRAPDPEAVLASFVDQLIPVSGWTDTFGETFSDNEDLLNQLNAPTLKAEAIDRQKVRLRLAFERWQQIERTVFGEEDESFE